MKIILKNHDNYVLRFDKDEDVFEELGKFCESEKITAASFSGIGAAKHLVLAYYVLKTKLYEDTEIDEEVEILNITGNIGMLNEKPVIHAHGNFADRELQSFGGHVKKLIVSATCEIFLQKFSDVIERNHSKKIGLNLMK